MGNNKRSSTTKNHTPVKKHSSHNVKRRIHSQRGKIVSNGKASKAIEPAKVKTPFGRADRVLLVGEGDYSFALSLAKNYDVAAILATSYDSRDALIDKYPNITTILDELNRLKSSDAEVPERADDDDEEWNGFSPQADREDSEEEPQEQTADDITVVHGVDAASLSKAHKKLLSRHAPFTKIVFNFPHTGGLSTDVNRQVRANQELLVGFFDAAKPLLATKTHPAKARLSHVDDIGDYDSDEDPAHNESATLSSGQILVTLFEGEPYTLWNIRDLARHSGLRVIESFKFPWSAYPGYKHARTIGDVKTGKDRSDEGKRKGAWRGEERDARCYVLGLKDKQTQVENTGKKRKRGVDSDDSS